MDRYGSGELPYLFIFDRLKRARGLTTRKIAMALVDGCPGRYSVSSTRIRVDYSSNDKSRVSAQTDDGSRV